MLELKAAELDSSTLWRKRSNLNPKYGMAYYVRGGVITAMGVWRDVSIVYLSSSP